jgi:glycosyltransferase involved in cell wall biosynthesis
VKHILKKKKEERHQLISSKSAPGSVMDTDAAERVPTSPASETRASDSKTLGVCDLNNPPVLLARRKPSFGAPSAVFFLADWLPASDRASGALRTFSMLQILRAAGRNLVFGADHDKAEHINFFGSEGDVHQYEATLKNLRVQVLYGFHEITRYLTEEGCGCSHVVLSFPEVAYHYMSSVRAYALNAKVIYDPVDLHWLRLQRESAIMQDDLLSQKSEDYRQIERFNAAAADVVLAITEEEKALILNDVPSAAVEVIPNIHICVERAHDMGGRQNLLFIGHYAHTPNEDAVKYFVREIFPLIRRQLPGVTFNMVGSYMSEAVKSLASRDVVPVGYVPDLSSYLNNSRVFVAPLRYGAGMKGKIGQSMSFGLPVVTTSIGAEGLNLTNGEHALIADSPAEFASAVVRLYTDDLLWEKMSTSSLRHIKAHFSYEIVRPKLEQVFSVKNTRYVPALVEIG